MFGYVFPDKPELKIREFSAYRAAYCALCRELRGFGWGAKLFLSYDFVFAAMLDMAANGADCTPIPGRCNTNPLEKVSYLAPNPALHRAAAALLVSVRYRLLDTCADEKLFRRIFARFALLFTNRAYRRAAAVLPEFDRQVNRLTRLQAELEQQNASLDQVCDPTAQALSYLFASMNEQSDTQAILRRLGYLMGRFVYLADAGDDLSADLRKGRYNPFIARFHLTKKSDPALLEAAHEEARAQLRLTEAQIESCYRLFRPLCWQSVLDNILYLGLKKVADQVGRPKKKGHRHHDQSL